MIEELIRRRMEGKNLEPVEELVLRRYVGAVLPERLNKVKLPAGLEERERIYRRLLEKIK